jgi:alkanesulfonate monooxygenase SsuD/methylene tetrahydromethanopterin reductase-like flavin-dependent oxidoreductase (luciferase family)
MMQIGVFATFMSPLATPQMIRDFAHRAEDIGLDSIWMGEHVALFDKNTFGYPGSKDGRIPVPAGGGMLDVVATFGFLAAASSGCASAPALHSCRSAIRSTPRRRCARWTG